MNATLRGLLRRMAQFGRALEDTALVTLLGTMIGLATLQILARNSVIFRDFLIALGTNLVWADELLRLLVLWLALLGAVAASREDRHIKIDLLSRFLAGRGLLAAQILVDLFTAAVCGVVAWQSLIFVRATRSFGDTVLGDLPAWIFQAVLPLAFAVIAYRYGLFVTKKVYQLASGRVPT